MTYARNRSLRSGRRWRRVVLGLLVATTALMAIPRTRVATFRSLGRALVVNDPVTTADAIVISVDADSAGVLEAADMVRNGISNTVAVFAEPPGTSRLEFQRRGIRYDDDASRALVELESLGVKNPIRIPTPVDGTTAEGRVLSAWVNERGLRSVVMITTADHARRTRRVLRRALKDQQTRVAVRASRYSDFEPDAWWVTRTGIRTEIIELQKLLLDIVTHPLP
jgi:hypothetical protein